ncbi:MAG: hypothetical protein DMG73_12445 [Acidobacteria bacterium]|nr:MAG: hypothetical protein DMG73_12445 [Acidobacteriota bacterium]PYX64138.1 MAG: hypothetical protein DMG74_14415 [Acidobacteriota bacterium]
MWLIHQFDPLLNLGICKEYPNMARAKTPRTNPINGSKQTSVPTEIQFTADVKKHVVPINLEDEIRRRAYELYEQRGCQSGHEHEDWLIAEREILSRYSEQQSA